MNDAGRIGFVIRGDYDSTATYDFLDIVFYSGSSYVAKKLTTGNEPNRDNEFWHIFAEKADEGDYVLKSDYATTEKAGIVKPDGTTITVAEDGTITGSNQTVVDAELSSTSENPVQNKVITESLSKKQDLLAKGHADDVSLDMNSFTETGVYTVGDTTNFTNFPEEIQPGFAEFLVFCSGSYVVQEIFTTGSQVGAIYYRFRSEINVWSKWQRLGRIYDGHDETKKGYSVDATQLNKEVEGSYAKTVEDDFAKHGKFLLPHAESHFNGDGLNISFTSPWSDLNQTCHVKRGESSGIPGDCEYGIREVYYYSQGKAGIRITGVDTDGKPATWSGFYDNEQQTWNIWHKNFRDTDFAQNVQFLENIPHSDKIQIPYGGCQNIIGCLFNRVVIMNLYFHCNEKLSAGETIFTLPEAYHPNYASVSITINDTAVSLTNYHGGIDRNGIIYSDTDIPAGLQCRINMSYFKY